MSLWSKITQAIDALSKGASFSEVLASFTKPPERSVAFAIAVIGLSAKMAKADGLVTRDEIAAFREVFYIPPEDEKNAARIFNLAREDVAGYEGYARSIAKMFERDSQILTDLIEGLFHIATADGVYHPSESEFLENVSDIFELSKSEFQTIKARSTLGIEADPYTILGIDREAELNEIRAHWKKLVLQHHPDRMMARGVPEEAVTIATNRIASINAAWEAISAERSTVS